MKLTTMFAMMFGAAAGVVELADPAAFFLSLDAPPEAMFMGASLLSVAALLRNRLSSQMK